MRCVRSKQKKRSERGARIGVDSARPEVPVVLAEDVRKIDQHMSCANGKKHCCILQDHHTRAVCRYRMRGRPGEGDVEVRRDVRRKEWARRSEVRYRVRRLILSLPLLI